MSESPHWDDDDPTCQGYDRDDEREREDEWVLDCGYEGCLMPGYHFRSECHNVEDMEAYYAEQETDS